MNSPLFCFIYRGYFLMDLMSSHPSMKPVLALFYRIQLVYLTNFFLYIFNSTTWLLTPKNGSNKVIVYKIHLKICFDSISLLRFALVIHSGSVSRLRPPSDWETRVEPNWDTEMRSPCSPTTTDMEVSSNGSSNDVGSARTCFLYDVRVDIIR